METYQTYRIITLTGLLACSTYSTVKSINAAQIIGTLKSCWDVGKKMYDRTNCIVARLNVKTFTADATAFLASSNIPGAHAFYNSKPTQDQTTRDWNRAWHNYDNIIVLMDSLEATERDKLQKLLDTENKKITAQRCIVQLQKPGTAWGTKTPQEQGVLALSTDTDLDKKYTYANQHGVDCLAITNLREHETRNVIDLITTEIQDLPHNRFYRDRYTLAPLFIGINNLVTGALCYSQKFSLLAWTAGVALSAGTTWYVWYTLSKRYEKSLKDHYRVISTKKVTENCEPPLKNFIALDGSYTILLPKLTREADKILREQGRSLFASNNNPLCHMWNHKELIPYFPLQDNREMFTID